MAKKKATPTELRLKATVDRIIIDMTRDATDMATRLHGDSAFPKLRNKAAYFLEELKDARKDGHIDATAAAAISAGKCYGMILIYCAFRAILGTSANECLLEKLEDTILSAAKERNRSTKGKGNLQVHANDVKRLCEERDSTLLEIFDARRLAAKGESYAATDKYVVEEYNRNKSALAEPIKPGAVFQARRRRSKKSLK